MAETELPKTDDAYLQKALEAGIRLGVVALLAAWCFVIIRPFVTPIVWGTILAVAVHPAYRWVGDRLGERWKLAAGLFTVAGVLIVILPTILFAGSLVQTGQQIAKEIDPQSFVVPPLPAGVAEWPIIGSSVSNFWSGAKENLAPLLVDLAPHLRSVALWIVSAGVGTGVALAQSLVSIVIAGVMLASASGGERTARLFAVRLAGSQGDRFARMATSTVRSVAVGIVGVAAIQSGLIGLGLIVFGVPHAGLWTFLCLVLAVIQVPPALVVLPIMVWIFNNEPTGVAVAFTVWELLATFSDNVLKPILLSRGVEVPMIVIFMGAIGGFVTSGFIGLFVGAVILSLGYELGRGWLQGPQAPGTEAAT